MIIPHIKLNQEPHKITIENLTQSEPYLILDCFNDWKVRIKSEVPDQERFIKNIIITNAPTQRLVNYENAYPDEIQLLKVEITIPDYDITPKKRDIINNLFLTISLFANEIHVKKRGGNDFMVQFSPPIAFQKSKEEPPKKSFKEEVKDLNRYHFDAMFEEIIEDCEKLSECQEELKIGDEVIINPKNFIANVDSVIETEGGYKYGITLKNGIKLRNPWPKEDLLLNKFDSSKFVVFLEDVQNIIKKAICWIKPYQDTATTQKENENLREKIENLRAEVREKENTIADLQQTITIKDEEIEMIEARKNVAIAEYEERISEMRYNAQIMPFYQKNAYSLFKGTITHTLFNIENTTNKDELDQCIDNFYLLLSKVSFPLGDYEMIFREQNIQELLTSAIYKIQKRNRILPRVRIINNFNPTPTYYEISYFLRKKSEQMEPMIKNDM